MRSTTRQAMLALGVLAALALVACGSAAASSVRHVAPKPVVKASAVAGGDERILTTPSGSTLYYFTADQDGKFLACTGDCLSTWQPLLLAHGTDLTGQGALPGALATIARPDGTRQVTYDGWPLYRFAGDDMPGDVKGQGIGGVWFAATAQVPELVPPPPTPTPTPMPAPPIPASNPPRVVATPPPPPPAFNDRDGDNSGAASDGDGNG